ncbi:component of IIS longevity pathway SMK-1-domain-containing protein [Leucosporidium creatinivorum]|uniref:Component of IIS longevity pathway SMK-1-domain-containing protein n=1 Tax=Leucosporidium creatinivorum TaxID=106004 RepID=A0A1Y2G4K6_9BASI|nr:component of IIS longevity pathway SMK-1-domain-containing protein [Leucosporidium creatinivorum]
MAPSTPDKTTPTTTSTTTSTTERATTPPPSTSSSSSPRSSTPPPNPHVRSSAPSPSDSPAAHSHSTRSQQSSTETPPKQHQHHQPGQASSSSSSSPSSSSSSPAAGGGASPHSSRRVKLYRLQDDAWIDLGTGTCAVHFIEAPPPSSSSSSSGGEGVEGASTPPKGGPSPEEGAWIIVRREAAKEGATSPSSSSSSPADGESNDILLRSKVMPYPPGYLSDEEDELESEGADGGRVVDAGGYQRQQETLIVWTDRELEREMALSFATATGCGEIWEFIKAARKWAQDQLPLFSPSPSPSLSSPQPFPHYHLTALPTTLPTPTLGNISSLETAIRSMARTAVGRERTASTIIKNQIVQKLIKVQEEAEDLESLEDLHALCRVMQTILLLNDNVIFDLILRDEVILGVASILEYDPEFPTLKASYRSHLSDPTHFTIVVPIRSPTLLAKIHQTHRLHYLKDVVLARILEDSTFSMLNSAIYFNEVDIVNEVAGDEAFLKELFGVFDEEEEEGEGESEGAEGGKEGEGLIGPLPPTTSTSSSSNIGPQLPNTTTPSNSTPRSHLALLFLLQFSSMAKSLQLHLRTTFFRSLSEKGLLRVIELSLSRPSIARDSGMRAAAVGILMSLVDHDPNGVRGWCLRRANATEAEGGAGEGTKGRKGSKPLMEFLIQLFKEEEDLGLKAQMSEALRVLVDAGGDGGPLEAPPRMRQEDPEAEKFLQYFYDHCTQALFAPILELPDRKPNDPPLLLSTPTVALCTHLCDLLCFFISHHTFRSKYFVLSSAIGTHIAKLFSTKHKHLRLAALRFFRATINKNDDFYNRFLIKNDLFRPVLEVVWEERGRDNLLGSAGLEFFEYVRTSNAKAVINHLVERYGERVRQLATTLKTFENLIIKWEQNNEPPPSATTVGGKSEGAPGEEKGATSKSMVRENSTWSRMEVEEEDNYFNGSDDEEDVPPPPAPAPAPLPTGPGQGRAPSSLPSSSSSSNDPPRTSRKREATSDDDAPPSPSSSSSTTSSAIAGTASPSSSSTSADRGKRLRLEKTKSQAELPLGGEGSSLPRSKTWPESGSSMPLVDYLGDDSDEEDKDKSMEGGFVRSTLGEEEMPPLPPASSEEGPPIPPKRRKDQDDDDGELGLLSKKKGPAVAAKSTSAAGPKMGAFSFGGGASKTVGGGAAGSPGAAVGGGIKISLGIKSSLSKLAGGLKGGEKEKEDEQKKEEEDTK